MRNFDELTRDIINAIPLREEVFALSVEQIEQLRKVGNSYDNHLYLDLLKRSRKLARRAET